MSQTIAELTAAMNAFVRAKGWYAAESIHPQTPRNLAISLSLEANEVLEHFQWRDPTPDALTESDGRDLGGELADVALYLLQLASVSGIDLEQAILAKLKANYDRDWHR